MKETEVVNSYIWKNLECEICKTSYADLTNITTLKDGIKEFNILNYKIHEDSSSYMVIESVTNTTSKTIHVINFSQQKKVKVVRILPYQICIGQSAAGRGQNYRYKCQSFSYFDEAY